MAIISQIWKVAQHFCLWTWGTDISALDELIRVSHMIGSRTALGGNDMSLGGLYHTTIYQWIDHVGVCEDYVFLLRYGHHGDRRWVFQRKDACPKLSYEWDNMTQFPDMVSSVIKDSSIFHWKLTKIISNLRLDISKANRFFRKLGAAPCEFSKFERT